jgi:hypothetical protein
MWSVGVGGWVGGGGGSYSLALAFVCMNLLVILPVSSQLFWFSLLCVNVPAFFLTSNSVFFRFFLFLSFVVLLNHLQARDC